MSVSWHLILIYVVGGYVLLTISDKYRFIKSRVRRYFVVILVYSLIFWGIYDLVLMRSCGLRF